MEGRTVVLLVHVKLLVGFSDDEVRCKERRNLHVGVNRKASTDLHGCAIFFFVFFFACPRDNNN